MHDIYQKTIAKKISFNGIGLHSGLMSSITLLPAEKNVGIIFKRIDKKENNIIKANFKNVTNSKLCTTIKNSSELTVSTVEHLMAAFYITGIDNILVEIDNSEVPIMDGSSKNFIEGIFRAGVKRQIEKRKFIKVQNEIELKEDSKKISIKPSDYTFDVNFEINYKNKFINKQNNHVDFYIDELEDIYSSRTFCLFEEIEKIKKIGLARGGSLDNAIVIKDDKVMNSGGLRNEKEFVNHKILDLAGDFMLSGYRIIGSVFCSQGGHNLSNAFLRKFLDDNSNFTLITLPQIKIVKQSNPKFESKLAVNS